MLPWTQNAPLYCLCFVVFCFSYCSGHFCLPFFYQSTVTCHFIKDKPSSISTGRDDKMESLSCLLHGFLLSEDKPFPLLAGQEKLVFFMGSLSHFSQINKYLFLLLYIFFLFCLCARLPSFLLSILLPFFPVFSLLISQGLQIVSSSTTE